MGEELSDIVNKHKKYIDHRLNTIALHIAYQAFGLFIRRSFRQHVVEGLDRIAQLKQSAPQEEAPVMIYTPEHWSEYDWILHQYVAFERDMPSAIVGGGNLRVSLFDRVLPWLGLITFVREEETTFYKTKWPFMYIEKALRAFGIDTRHTITKAEGDQTLFELMREDLEQGLDYMIYAFAERVQTKNMKKREPLGGRSKQGHIRPASSVIFKKIERLSRTVERPIYVVPSIICYEDIIELPNMERLEQLKAENKGSVYTQDFLYLFKHAAREIPKGRVIMRYGEPIRAEGYGRVLMHQVEEAVKKLFVPFPTTICCYAMRDMDHASEKELLDRIEEAREEIKQSGLDMRYLPELPAQILLLALPFLNQQNERQVISVQKGRIQIENSRIRNYYANQIKSALK